MHVPYVPPRLGVDLSEWAPAECPHCVVAHHTGCKIPPRLILPHRAQFYMGAAGTVLGSSADITEWLLPHVGVRKAGAALLHSALLGLDLGAPMPVARARPSAQPRARDYHYLTIWSNKLRGRVPQHGRSASPPAGRRLSGVYST